MDNMQPDEILDELFTRIKDRYVLENENEKSNSLKKLYPVTSGGIRVLRIRRTSFEKSCWKTLLFAFEIGQESIANCFTWAAAVQEELLNNESSDLYLFLIPKISEKMPKENCIYIESNDQFCRKYVMRPEESFLELMNRTFLNSHQTDAQINEMSDPLLAALNKTGQSIDFFSQEDQNTWKNILLSGMQGMEIAEELIKASTEKPQDDKA
jgi:hypothetical protein